MDSLCARSRFTRLVWGLVLLVAWAFPARGESRTDTAPASVPQEPGSAKEAPFTVHLQSRIFTPQRGVSEQTLKAITAIPRPRVHVLIQFTQPLTAEDRKRIDTFEVQLLKSVPRNAYFASVPNDLERLKQLAAVNFVRWIGHIQSEDKVAAELLLRGPSKWAVTRDREVRLLVHFFRDVPLAEGRGILEGTKGKEVKAVKSLHALQVLLPEDAILELARHDPVKWINELPPQGEDDNNGARDRLGVNSVQAAPMNLDGNAVLVGQWEVGNLDTTHVDFGTRVAIGDPPGVTSDHATHVAGTVLGDGSQSGGVYRGMAPAASIISYRRPTNGGALDVSTLEDQYDAALNDADKGIELSTNSWGTSHCDQTAGACYTEGSQLYDEIIRGSLGARVSIVASAGNRGDDVTPNWGTVRVPNSAKNTVVVAATFSDTDLITAFSSRGPTDDGRLKPDIAAPGDEDENGTGECTGDQIRSTVPGNAYDDYCGTSMATPAVAGSMALLIDRWRDVRGVGASDPWPSTVKAMMIHTAVDGGNPGPDYEYGYGRLNVAKAASLVATAPQPTVGVIQRTIEATGTQDDYEVTIPALSSFWLRPIALKATLVWDDPPGDPALARGTAQLVNDLDLVVIAPNGTSHRPWVLDPSNPANAATRGEDHTNNVEKVEVSSPASGTWKIRVLGSNLREGPQPYSLVYQVVHRTIVIDKCRLFPDGCLAPKDMFRGGMVLECKVRGCVIIDPVPKNCTVKVDCPGCRAGLCPPVFEFVFENVADWRISLFDFEGAPVPFTEQRARGTSRITFRPNRDRFMERGIGPYFFAFELLPKGKINVEYRIPVRVEVVGKSKHGIAEPAKE